MRIGVIGCGAIAARDLPYLLAIDGIEEVGLCDVEGERARALAARYGLRRTFREAGAMLSELRPTVVHVLTPPQTHRELAVEAMQAGCHVMVEKPMAMAAEEADEMIEVSRRQGVTLGVCHHYLFDPAVLQARRLVDSGGLGEIAAMRYLGSIPRDSVFGRYPASPWLRDLPGGYFQEAVPHPIYLFREFLGPLRVASAVGRKRGGTLPGPFDEVQVSLEGESGLGALIWSSRVRPFMKAFTIYGTEMSLQVDLTNHTLVRLRIGAPDSLSRALVNLDKSLQLLTQTGINTWRALSRTRKLGERRLIEKFYAGLREGTGPPVTGEAGRDNIAVLDQIWAALSGAGSAPAAGRRESSL